MDTQPQEPQKPSVCIVDVNTADDVAKAMVFDDVDDALKICEVVAHFCGGARWEELPNGKYVVKAPNNTYLCELIPGEPENDDEDEEPDAWAAEEVLEMLTNPVYVGLGEFPPIVELDKFAGAGANVVKERGEDKYLECIYNNLQRHGERLGNVSRLGTREEFVAKEGAKLRNATSRKQGIKKLIERLRRTLAQE
jgi:hypothetical protein